MGVNKGDAMLSVNAMCNRNDLGADVFVDGLILCYFVIWCYLVNI